MSSNIVLSPGVRQNLLSLQNTAALASITQFRLATGKKVNSALDSPTSFFTSASLQDRATDLNSLLDSIGQAQQTLKAADQGITSLTTLVQSAKAITTQALQATKGTVNYTNVTGSVALPADTTRVTSASSIAAAGATDPSVQATATLDVSALVTAGAAANGQTITLNLNGVNKTYTFNNAAGNGTTVFSTLAELRTEVIADFVTAGAVATVGAIAGTSFSATSRDVLSDFSIGGSAVTGPGTLATTSSTAHSIGGTFTVSDGTHTQNFYYVAAGASAANNTFSDATTLAASIQLSNLHTVGGVGGPLTAAANGTTPALLDVTGGSGTTVTFSGTIATAAGYSASPYSDNYNSTLSPLSGNVTVQIGASASHTISFGTSFGQVGTKAALHAALAAFNDIVGSVDTTGHFHLAPTSSDNVAIGGTPAALAALGLTAGTTSPSATVLTPNTTRASLQTDYNNLLTQIDMLAKDASYNGINLLDGDGLKVIFNSNSTSLLDIVGVRLGSFGLGLTAVSGTGFQDNKVVNDTIAKIDTALTTLRTQASKFGSNLTTVQTRQDFTKNLITTLQTGADNLVLADTNEEGANLLALQTRQQLSTTALSLANQASQAVLRLFS